MFSIVNIARSCLSVLVSLIYSLLSLITSGFTVNTDLPVTPEDFSPVVRFAVCSDVHINGTEGQAEPERFASMIQTVYAYADNSSYKGVDAICAAGDFTNSGEEKQYEIFNSVADENLRDGTQLITCIGNHEFISYRDTDATVGITEYEKMMGTEANMHYVLNGYHFISVSYDSDGKSFTSSAKWLREQLDAAVADTGDKPIFVMQHPAPFGTIYGSVNWGDLTMSKVLNRYPQVIDFSGHSHYPVNDPRSLWQGTFTALGCGTLSYFETELDCVAGNFPYEVKNAAQFYIVEADIDGNVRVKAYDLISDNFFDFEYYFSDLADKNYPYTYSNMKSLDAAPEFADGTEVYTEVNSDGETVLTFRGAKDTFVTESYKVSVTCNAIKVFSDNFSGKYMYLNEDDIYSVNLGKLTPGKTYRAEIVAMNAYAKLSSPLTYTFTAE